MQWIEGDVTGRREDVARVVEQLQAGARLITLTGMGGVGKTVIAREVLKTIAGDAVSSTQWIGLVPGVPDDDIFELVGESMNTARAAPAPGLPLKLVVVDSCPEADLHAMRQLLSRVLSHYPDLQILVTSRGRLRMSVERVVQVKPLVLPDGPVPSDPTLLTDFVQEHSALQFMVERAGAISSDLKMDQNTVSGLLALCRRLGGLPLAIQMASLRINILSPAALLAELDQSLDVLEDFEPSVPARHHSMSACLSASLAHLEDQELDLLTVIAALEGGCTLESLRSLRQGVAESSHLLSQASTLVEQQLVRSVPSKPEGTRLLVVPLVRDYLKVEGLELDRDRKRDVSMVLLGQARAWAKVRGPESDLAREWLDGEYANALQAMTWLLEGGDTEAAAELVHSLHLYWLYRGLFDEGLLAAERILDYGGLSLRGSARVKSTLGSLRAHLISYRSAYDELLEAVDLWREADSPSDLGNALMAFSTAAFEVDGYDASAAALNEALLIFQELNDGWAHARALALLGAAAAHDPQKVDYARRCLEDASTALLKHGDQVAASLPFEQLGRLLLDDGEHDRARILLEHGLRDSISVGDQVQASSFLNLLALADAQTGHHHKAAERYLESLEIAVQKGLKPRAVWCLEGIAESITALGHDDDLAAIAAASADALRDELGLEFWVEFCCPRRSGHNGRNFVNPLATLAVIGGAPWPPTQVLARVPDAIAAVAGDSSQTVGTEFAAADGLTRRESEILRLVAGGYTNQDIADQLVISLDTVKRRVTNLCIARSE